MNKKKVLMFLQSGVGGAERVTVNIGKSLEKKMYDVTFCLLVKPSNETSIEEFIPDCYKKIQIPRVGGVKLLYYLWQVLKSEKPDLVFSSMMYINTKILALSKFFPKINFIVRNNNYLYTLSEFQKLVIKLTYNMADHIIAQTQEMADELVNSLKIEQQKIHVLQNPIDIKTIEEKIGDQNPFVNDCNIKYIATGRFAHAKGFDVLVKAFSLLLKKQPNSELFIVGNNKGVCSAYFEKVKAIVDSLNIGNNVKFVGYSSNPYKYMKYADCFVLSSRNEGLPNVLIEAQYLGTPAAATTCIPVIERIVMEGKTGYLAAPNDEESLCSAMIKAAKLGRIKSQYKATKLEDFHILFK